MHLTLNLNLITEFHIIIQIKLLSTLIYLKEKYFSITQKNNFLIENPE